VTNCAIAAFPWTENFENAGVIPNCWTQEQVNNSGVNWTFITGNGTGYPPTAHSGIYNACLKDVTSADNKTRLITPAMDLSQLPSPQVKFWHTQAYWSPDQDLLSVFYKTSSGGTWTLLTTYTASITSWTQETIALPAGSSNYYIAFEGNAKYGRGVCIDDVEISSSCPVIYPVSVTIAASLNPVDTGTPVTFTATPANGGTTPAYQWQVNGINAGTNNSQYTYVPVSDDQVTCQMTSNASCVTGNPANSNLITMIVNSVPSILNLNGITVSGPQCFDATQTITVAGSNTTFIVQNGGTATMIAGQNIIYYPGTLVVPGGILHGYISPGGPYCIPLDKPQSITEIKEMAVKPEKSFFRIYPNPTTGNFTLALDGYVPADKISFDVFNAKGERVISTELYNEMKHEFSLAGNPAGLYLVKVTSGWQSGSSRLVKIN